jgi:TatD DNase family protein
MSPGRLVDSHCHLQLLDPDDRAAALERARERGVRGFLAPATHFEEVETLLRLCEDHPDVWCALGVHPHQAGRWRSGDAARLAELTAHPKVVAVGECGLDFHYDFATREEQERALREQWEVAVDHGLPAVVHNRESNDAMLALLEEPGFAALQADFHSFAGGRGMGERLVARGFALGFTGMVTFRRADNVREVLPLVPEERLLVETDTPYLAPVPYRGRPNEPAYVVEVARRVGEERGWSE